MPNVPLGFPEYGMINATIFASNPHRVKKEGIYFGNDIKAKSRVKSNQGLSGFGSTYTTNFRWGLPLPASPNGDKKGIFIYGNDA